jgi:hypothetical protein
MTQTNCSSNIVPYGADQTLYLVVDGFGDGATQFNDPLRVIAFNTLEHWSEDVSVEIALEIQSRCDMDGRDLPEHIKDFVERSTRRVRRSAASTLGYSPSAARFGC